MSTSLELEIKALLDELGSPEAILERLVPYVEGSEDTFTSENVAALARFLIRANLGQTLIDFTVKHWSNPDFKIPWPHFLEAIAASRPKIEFELAEALMAGIDESRAHADASRSKALDAHAPALRSERADRRLQAIKHHRAQKQRLLEQLITLRTQQLYEQERQLLQRLQRMYPGDAEVLREARSHKERYALDILAKHSRLSKGPSFSEPQDAEVDRLRESLQASLLETAAQEPQLGADLAVAAATLEMWEAALGALHHAPPFRPLRWLRLELLLGAERHLEVLDELATVERENAEDPETFFATAYLRAQALWGLGQKHQAIEILESLLTARPNYRSANSLLLMWRSA